MIFSLKFKYECGDTFGFFKVGIEYVYFFW